MYSPFASNPGLPAALHIPDGFLNLPVSLSCWLLSILILGFALRRGQDQIGERAIPLMGVMAAFIFAAQMINFPVAGGTSGHLLGGALAAITLGPWAGMIVMAAVIGVQALLFQDGGLLAMGANILNMGLLTSLIGYGLYRAGEGRKRTVRLGLAGLAAWLSVLASALATSLQLWLSGTSPLQVVMPAMLGVHIIIGFGEAAITVAALGFILRTRPDLISANGEPKGGRGWTAAGVALTLIVIILSPLASANPDGLERVALDLGFAGHELDPPFKILADYALPVLGETNLSTITAGFLGVLILVGFISIGILLLKRQHSTGP